MANSAQSRKRARQEKTRRARNAGIRTHFRTAIKRARAAAGGDGAAESFRQMQSTVDKATQKINVPAKTAARLKRRISRQHKAAALAAPADPAEV